MDTQSYDLPGQLRPHWVGADEASAIRSLYIGGFASGSAPENPIHALTEHALYRLLSSGWTRVYVVRKRTDTRRGEIVSMATLLVSEALDGMKGFVHHVATHPEHRGRGLGFAVMQHLVAQADSTGIAEIGLTCSHKRSYAWPLYRRLGFVEVTPTNTPYAEGDTVLFKRLRPCQVAAEAAA